MSRLAERLLASAETAHTELARVRAALEATRTELQAVQMDLQKAQQLGTVKEISEDAESGSLTIKLEV